MQTQQYQDYMRSDEWEDKKQERIAMDGGCVMCGRPISRIRSVQVHHITYARLGNENVLTDLCTLCGSCHKKIHAYRKLKQPEQSTQKPEPEESTAVRLAKKLARQRMGEKERLEILKHYM